MKSNYFFKKSRQIYRLFTINNCVEHVWNDMLRFFKTNGFRFGQYENEKVVDIHFETKLSGSLMFKCNITDDKLIFRGLILSAFDIDRTSDVLVLAAHFNAILKHGRVSASTEGNFVEFIYEGNLLTYLISPDKIEHDFEVHFNITTDCIWAFKSMIQSGDNPVFVISQLLEQKENVSKIDNN